MTQEKDTNEAKSIVAVGSTDGLDIRAKKLKNVLVEVELKAECPRWIYRYCDTKEETAKRIEQWIKEFDEFIRDHRSQDAAQLYVERVRKDLCSNCDSVWETMEENGKTFCASCGKEVEDV